MVAKTRRVRILIVEVFGRLEEEEDGGLPEFALFRLREEDASGAVAEVGDLVDGFWVDLVTGFLGAGTFLGGVFWVGFLEANVLNRRKGLEVEDGGGKGFD